MLSETQVPCCVRTIAEGQLKIYKEGRTIQDYNELPPTNKIPIEDGKHWLKVEDVICVFVDMKGSTKLSAARHDKSTAGAYQLFTQTAVEIFHAFKAPYIDVRGDGVFALFNSDSVYRSLAAAVSFKTFADDVFVPQIRKDTEQEVGAHSGIDIKTVLVRKLGLKRYGDRSDRQNEVWAGKPINMASKLAAMGAANELLVSDRFYELITDDLVRKSCGCPTGEKNDLWTEKSLTGDEKFDFDKTYSLTSNWCATHGKEYCENILALDEE
jgi:class 3 adenylate cyclase